MVVTTPPTPVAEPEGLTPAQANARFADLKKEVQAMPAKSPSKVKFADKRIMVSYAEIEDVTARLVARTTFPTGRRRSCIKKWTRRKLPTRKKCRCVAVSKRKKQVSKSPKIKRSLRKSKPSMKPIKK